MHAEMGIDEAGRGCLAGPLVFAAVILNQSIAGITDSKQLTRNQRNRLFHEISSVADFIGIGIVSPREIDRLGLTKSSMLACRRATQNAPHVKKIIIDGSINYLPQYPNASPLIRADTFISSVSAASIIAKVRRDSYMFDQAKKYPLYGFERHVGYGTAYHKQAIETYGVVELHRLSFKPLTGYKRP